MSRQKIEKKYTKEALLKSDVKTLLDDHKVQWIMVVPHGYGKNAVDFLVNYRGHFLSIETKVGDNVPTVQQWDWLVETVKSGGSAVVAYNLNDVVMALHSLAVKGGPYICNRVVEEMNIRYKVGML